MGQVLCSSVWGLGSRSQNWNGRAGLEPKGKKKSLFFLSMSMSRSHPAFYNLLPLHTASFVAQRQSAE